MSSKFTNSQIDLCRRIGVKPSPSPRNYKVGIALNVREGLMPINGLRHVPIGDTTGWYIWAGEQLSDDPDYFVPLDVEHLDDWCPTVIPYLALPAGWRFILAPGYEDVWEDDTLIQS